MGVLQNVPRHVPVGHLSTSWALVSFVINIIVMFSERYAVRSTIEIAFSLFRLFFVCNMIQLWNTGLFAESIYTTWYRTGSGMVVLSYGRKRLLNGHPPFWIFKNVHIWSAGSHRVSNVHFVYQSSSNRVIFRWDMDFIIFKMADLRHLEF